MRFLPSLPSIKDQLPDMGLGVPRTDGMPRPQLDRGHQMPSCNSFLPRPNDIQPGLSQMLSPVSMSSPQPLTWDSPPRPETITTSDREVIIDHKEVQHALSIPRGAHVHAGGWFDVSNWLYQLVLKKFGHLPEDELLQAYFTRTPRPEYGEDHVSTRNKRPGVGGSLDILDDISAGSNKTSHPLLERERRDRHRVLCKEFDQCTGDAIYAYTEEVLGDIKQIIKDMPKDMSKDVAAPAKERKEKKKTGKDEQLASAAMMPYLASLLIFRLLSSLDEAVKAYKHERRSRVEAEQRMARLEHENRPQADEILDLRHRLDSRIESRRSSSASFATTELLPPLASNKRKFVDNELVVTNTKVFDRRNDRPEAKRTLTKPKMLHPSQYRHHYRTPPSPCQSCDENVSPMSSFTFQ